MSTVVRSRSLAVEPERAWRLIADPHNLPRWWPETVRVESVEGAPGARRSRFTQVFETSKGRPVRADYRITESTARERLVWEQQIDGTPFEKFLRAAVLEFRIAGDGADRQPGHARSATGAARHVAARGADDARSDEALARIGPRRDRARAARRGRVGTEPGGRRLMTAGDLRRDSAWWGWGRATDRPTLSDSAKEMVRDELGATEPAPAVELAEVSLPAAEQLPGRIVAAAGGDECLSTEAEDRIRHAAGKSYPDLFRVRTGALERAPDAVLAPGRRRCRRRRPRGLRARARRRRPVRRRHQRRRRRRAAQRRPRQARLARPDGDARGPRRRALADGDARARPARPGGRGRPERRRLHARALPAVVSLRDDRRLRSDPLRRPGLERLRPLRRARHVGDDADAARGDHDAADAAHGGGAGPARADRRIGGDARA